MSCGPPSVGASRTDAQAASSSAVRLVRSEEHTSELQSPCNLVCRLLLEKKKKNLSKPLFSEYTHPDEIKCVRCHKNSNAEEITLYDYHDTYYTDKTRILHCTSHTVMTL